MAKMKVHELAKELGLESKELISIVQDLGIECKSHMTSLEDNDIEKVKAKVKGGAKAPAKTVAKAEPKTETKAAAGNKPKIIVVRREDKDKIEEKKKAERESLAKQINATVEKKNAEAKEKEEAERPRREERPARPRREERPVREDRPARPERPAREDRPQRDEKPQRQERTQRDEKPRFEKQEKSFNKPERNNDRPNKFKNDRNDVPSAPIDAPKSDKDNSRWENKSKYDKNNKYNTSMDEGNGYGGKKKKEKQKQVVVTAPRDLSKKEVKKYKKEKKTDEEVVEELPIITVPENMTVNEFASKINKPTAEIIKSLMLKGIFANINQLISFDTCSQIAEEYEILLEKEKEENVEEILMNEIGGEEAPEEDRPPVVVVMGHVDHGKTSLLDAMRKTSVIETEQGGITQHIGASVVEHQGKKITFLDTPGHEAFTAMRLRGAKVTDIAILVVAADDGVMPQTVEAIDHAKVAGIPVIVAVNKIDKPEANPERVKQELAGYGIVSEEWGGDNIFVEVSAKAGKNIESLLDTILLVAEMQNLKARKQGLAKGAVIEARLDKNKGVIATLLVEQGTLHSGDPIFIGETSGSVRVMINDKGKRIKTAEPGTPVEITGLNKVPMAGDSFYVTTDQVQAREFAEKEAVKQRERKMLASHNVSLDSLFTQIQSGEVKKLNILVKADVQGSAEAVRQSLEKLSNEEVIVSVIRSAAGAITESDVTLAAASNAIIIGFNLRPTNAVQEAADRYKVDIKTYRIIYEAIDEVEQAMKGMLSKKYQEKVVGHAEVRKTFKASSVGTIAGCMIIDGSISKGNKVRLLRDEVIVFEGEMAGLKREKDDVKEVKKGFECGITLEGFTDIRENDVIEAYIMEEVKR